MVELVDTLDSKSGGLAPVSVRLRLLVFLFRQSETFDEPTYEGFIIVNPGILL